MKTYHEGANDERTAILAKVRRMMRKHDAGFTVGGKLKTVYVNREVKDLETWLLDRDKRYKKRNGGL